MSCRFNPSMMVVIVLGAMPLLMDFFAVAMGIDHREDEDNESTDQQHNDDGLIPPDFADEL